MLFVVLFTDKPDHGHLRVANLQAHIDWLERNRDVIPVGGSLRHEPSETPKGGLWIAQADSKQQLEALLAALVVGIQRQVFQLHRLALGIGGATQCR